MEEMEAISLICSLIGAILLTFLYNITQYGLFFNGTIMLWGLFLYTFARYLYHTDIKKEMEENIMWLLIGAIVLTFLYYGTQYGLLLYGTIMLWGLLLCTFALYLYRTVIKAPAEIRQLREKIRDYRPSQWTIRDAGDGFERPSKVRLGVFGVQNSGKSSFLNSLHFAFKGNWEEVYVEKGNASVGGETMFREPVKLSDSVTTFDTRGLADLSVSKVPEVIAEITGQRGIDNRSYAPGEKIDCPIFILRYSSDTEDCTEFLESLVPEVWKHLCGYPILVVTFADNIGKRRIKRDNTLGEIIRDDILRKITMAGMHKGSVFFIENYTAENHEMDSKKHIALLNILEACIKRADDIISLRSIGEKEKPNMPHY